MCKRPVPSRSNQQGVDSDGKYDAERMTTVEANNSEEHVHSKKNVEFDFCFEQKTKRKTELQFKSTNWTRRFIDSKFGKRRLHSTESIR